MEKALPPGWEIRVQSAITLAETIVKMQGKRAARVVVWREDEVIFESPDLLLLH